MLKVPKKGFLANLAAEEALIGKPQ